MALFSFFGVLAGCGGQEEIERYYVDKPSAGGAGDSSPTSPHPNGMAAEPPVGTAANPHEPAVATKQRLLGAIIPRGSQCWFFKMIGPADAVAPHAEEFAALVESIHFGEGEGTTPTWDLPEGWHQDPGGGMRLATIRPDPDDPALEMSVIPLQFRGDDVEEYVLANVNRWRAQVGLVEIDASGLAEEAAAVELGDTTATVVDVEGMPASDGAHPMGMGPMGGGRD